LKLKPMNARLGPPADREGITRQPGSGSSKHQGGCVETTAGNGSPNNVVRVFSALSDPNRLRIVELLSADGIEMTCGAISGALGLSPSLLSHHLSVLEGAGVIGRRREGLWTLNRLRREEIGRLIANLQSIVEPPGEDRLS